MSGLPPVLVAGPGSWGTTLAMVAARSGREVRLWGRNKDHLRALAADRENARYLPGIALPASLTPVEDLAAAVDGVDTVLIVVPSVALRETVAQLEAVAGQLRYATACKGFERSTGMLPDQVIADEVKRQVDYAVLSGPNFASEIAAGMPAATAVAATSERFGEDLVALLHGGAFRVYRSDDVAGVEIGGALKNIYAIAAGISDGLKLGANSRAALVTRALAEISRFGEHFGARPVTFMGLSGMGDLVLSCTDDQSRNRRLGLQLATGATPEAAHEAVGGVVEGMRTATIVAGLAREHGIDMPICQAVDAILSGGETAAGALFGLLSREATTEFSFGDR